MSKHCSADVARPHAQGGRQLTCHFWMTSQVFAQTSLIHIELATNGAGVVGRTPLGCKKKTRLIMLMY